MKFTVKKQSGFIQNLIIPGIFLLGVIISCFSFLTSGSSRSSPARERIQFNANAILMQSATIQVALSRALGDGSILRANTGSIDLPGILAAGKMGILPTPPDEGLTVQGTAWLYSQATYRVKDGSALDVGSTVSDDVLYLPQVTPQVCASINYKLYGGSSVYSGDYLPGGGEATGTDISAAAAVIPLIRQPGALEGCVAMGGTTTNYIYYKVIGVR